MTGAPGQEPSTTARPSGVRSIAGAFALLEAMADAGERLSLSRLAVRADLVATGESASLAVLEGDLATWRPASARPGRVGRCGCSPRWAAT